MTTKIAWHSHRAGSSIEVWPLSLGEGHGPPTLVELFGGRGAICERLRRFGSDQLEQKRAREQPERYTGEDTVRGPREESVCGMSWVRHWVFRLPANLVFCSVPGYGPPGEIKL